MTTTGKILTAAVLIGTSAFLLTSASIPKKATAVKNFDAKKYLGTWYEIARLDFKFEKHMDNTTAQYSFDEKSNVVVLNSGYNVKKGEWTKADGLAKFRGETDIAELKVSFFGPFYAGYNVIALDPNYQYALVAGKNLDYLWILSREKTIPAEIKTKYLEIAQQVGYNTDALIWVKHDKSDNPYLGK